VAERLGCGIRSTAFVFAFIWTKRVTAAPPASKVALLRRAYFDLIGLPPPPEKLTRFWRMVRLGAFERVVDRLLQSPQYGERWPVTGLDLVRFAETNSYDGQRQAARVRYDT